MTKTILVTGATGTVGQHVVGALKDRDCTVKIGVRDPERVPSDTAAAGETIAFDFTKPETWGAALDGTDSLFLVRPPVVERAAIESFVDAAARVGVDHVVYLSTIGAEKNPLIPHHRIEKRISGTEMAYTFIRASFFMQNLLEVHRQDIVAHDEVFVPAGTGENELVDARDIGEVAAVLLTEPGHENRAYDITGPEALTYHDVAEVFSDVLGRPITYPEPSLLAFARRLSRRGLGFGFIALMCGIYTTARLGLAGRVTADSEQLLGRPPRGMKSFVEDYFSARRESRPSGRE